MARVAGQRWKAGDAPCILESACEAGVSEKPWPLILPLGKENCDKCIAIFAKRPVICARTIGRSVQIAFRNTMVLGTVEKR